MFARRNSVSLIFLSSLGVTCLLGCSDDLSRSSAQAALNGEYRGYACQSSLSFVDGGFKKADAAGLIKNQSRNASVDAQLSRLSSGMGPLYLAAAIPGTDDRWIASSQLFEQPVIYREKKPKGCIPGAAEIALIAEGPLPSFKLVEFVEVVQLPPELSGLKELVILRYRKEVPFQKTDKGWLPRS